jgi:hypothetical protein
MMLAVVVGVVLVSGALLKQFMPSLFGSIQQMIAGTASSEASSSADGGGTGLGTGTSSTASGSNSKSIASAASAGSGLSGGVAAAGGPVSPLGADGGSRAGDGGGHPGAKPVPPPHQP